MLLRPNRRSIRKNKIRPNKISSFTEEVKDFQSKRVCKVEGAEVKELVMSWNNLNNEDAWLSRCAVGTLQLIPKIKLIWINCIGVPLRFWNSSFFTKLGWLVGELILVEEVTLNKRRFDRGKILVLLQHNQFCPKKIKIKVDSGAFEVETFEDSLPVDSLSTAKLLGLEVGDVHPLKAPDVESDDLPNPI
ncbi:hypothetical protein Dsin_028589 [Dipteronia sinensis]|uniref:DUF4283 domain-containing protein n=1 Tax=Dipteronia sinensis TaxID=43782 RepID=A0AAD9ZQQ2_9ROSI|nr:hypothetical protein Dsin_028589 [Dipteronia sinensis]